MRILVFCRTNTTLPVHALENARHGQNENRTKLRQIALPFKLPISEMPQLQRWVERHVGSGRPPKGIHRLRRYAQGRRKRRGAGLSRSAVHRVRTRRVQRSGRHPGRPHQEGWEERYGVPGSGMEAPCADRDEEARREAASSLPTGIRLLAPCGPEPTAIYGAVQL